jgi:hypothetical protein
VKISRAWLIHFAASAALRAVRRLLHATARGRVYHEVQHLATGAYEDSQRHERLGLNLQPQLLEELAFWEVDRVWVRLHYDVREGLFLPVKDA